MMMTDSITAVQSTCEALLHGGKAKARGIVRSKYPFKPLKSMRKRFSPKQCMHIFIRDGFIDRYSREKLVLPATLRLLSVLLPEEFPFHPNWRYTKTHIAYWELSPTIDHVMPVARGGSHDEANLVTTSMLRNSAKANWTLKELGWRLFPPGEVARWDGLTRTFLDLVDGHPEALLTPYIKQWHNAALKALGSPLH